MRVLVLAVSLTAFSACATSTATPWSHTRDSARAAIREYCQNSSDPVHFCATFERAMAGDFAALHSVLADLRYQGQDTSFDELVPRQLLVLVGDERFAAFARAEPAAARDTVLAEVGPGVDTTAEQERFFARRFPQTYALWRSYGPFSEHTRERLRQPRPNQSMERTAARFASTLCDATTRSLRSTRAPGGGRSSLSR